MFFLALRSLFRRRLRSALTIAGVSVGTVAYLVIVATAAGLLAETQAGIDALGTDVSILQSGATMPWLSHLAPAEVERMRAVPHVATQTPVVVGLVRLDRRSRFIVFGLRSDARLMQSARIIEGRLFRPNSGELLIGRYAARKLGIHAGDRVELMRRVFRVVGVYETGRAILDSGASIDLAAAQSIFNLGDRVSIVFLDLAEPARIDDVLAHLAREMPSIEAMPSDLFTESFQRIGIVQRYGEKLAILAFLIAALGVCNTLAMNVSERTQEIAMLRAIGWRRSRIAAAVVIETMGMVAIGALLAVPLSEAVLLAMQSGDAIGIVPRHVPIAEVMRGITLAIVVGFALSLLPLTHAMRVRPAIALRAI